MATVASTSIQGALTYACLLTGTLALVGCVKEVDPSMPSQQIVTIGDLSMRVSVTPLAPVGGYDCDDAGNCLNWDGYSPVVTVLFDRLIIEPTEAKAIADQAVLIVCSQTADFEAFETVSIKPHVVEYAGVCEN